MVNLNLELEDETVKTINDMNFRARAALRNVIVYFALGYLSGVGEGMEKSHNIFADPNILKSSNNLLDD